MKPARKTIIFLFLSIFLISFFSASIKFVAAADQGPTSFTIGQVQVSSVGNLYRHQMLGNISCDAANVLTSAYYYFEIEADSFYNIPHILTPTGAAASYFETGTPYGYVYLNPQTLEHQEYGSHNNRSCYYPFEFTSPNFLSPDGALNTYGYHTGVGITLNWYTAGGSVDAETTKFIPLTIIYDLKLNLEISSPANYNLDSIRVYTRTDISTTYKEQDVDNIRIDSYHYGIKIVDKYTGDILLEDPTTTTSHYTLNRAVTLTQLKFLPNLIDDVSRIYTTHRRGDRFIDMDMYCQFRYYSGSYKNLIPGTYYFTFDTANNMAELYTIEDAGSASTWAFSNHESTAVVLGTDADEIDGLVKSRQVQYILNTSYSVTDPLYSDASMTMSMDYAFNGYGYAAAVSLTALTNVMLYYHLEPQFTLSSTYYNAANIRVQYFDKVNVRWIESELNSIVLLHPEYKLRIYDKETNALIYQDLTFVKFTQYRTITINSLQLINNADESVIIKVNTVSTTVNPFSSSIIDWTPASVNYWVYDLYTNILESGSITSVNTSISYIPPNNFQNFVSLSNQRMEYLNWENYRIKVNSTQIYNNIFYYELSHTANVSIYTRDNRYINSTLHTVTRNDNYIPITIPQFSFKIYNQQEKFILANITYDPNYFVSSYVWQEWIAPGEVIKFYLSADHYKVNITEYETSTESIYAYDLVTDDLLLVTSTNTILNVLSNIQNVNSTIGNQITNVQIDLTNQNSAINNTIINLEINLNNTNSSLNNLLLNQQTSINNIANNISTLYVYQQNQFMYVTNNITSSYTSLNSSLYLVNNSIYTAINAMEANLLSINNTISGNLTLILSQNEYLTQIYQYTMFSDFLDWSNATRDDNFIKNQIDTWEFLNEYRNDTVELFLRYNSTIESLLISAQDHIFQTLPRTGVEYRVKSLSTGEYLEDWEPLNSTKQVDIGFYQEDIPINPNPLYASIDDLLYFGLITLAIIFAIQIYNFIKPRRRVHDDEDDFEDKSRRKGKKHVKARKSEYYSNK